MEKKQNSTARMRNIITTLAVIPVPPLSEKDDITLLKNNNSERKATEEIFPKCRRKFEYLSAGIYAKDSGIVQYYPEHCRLCDACCQDEEWYT